MSTSKDAYGILELLAMRHHARQPYGTETRLWERPSKKNKFAIGKQSAINEELIDSYCLGNLYDFVYENMWGEVFSKNEQ